jgi:two-component system, NarL family, invasion response regulator UvrY
MKILICEDHTLVRQNMRKLLEETSGISFVAEARSGKHTLEVLQKNPVDIVLLDLNLQDIHGFEVLEKIGAEWPQIKVLVLSADAYEVSAVKAFQKGAWCYLNKDIDFEILIEALNSLYKGKQYILPEVMKLLAGRQNINADQDLHKKLTEREYEVMIKLAEGKSYGEIAKELFISEKTVGSHRSHIVEKLELKLNTELTLYCIKHKLI